MMWVCNNCSLCYTWTTYKSSLNFCCTNAMARNIDYVIYTTGNPNISITITRTSITREIIARVRVHIDTEISRVVTKTRSCHTRPRFFYCQYSRDFIPFYLLSCFRVQNCNINTIEGKRATPWLHWCDTGQVCNDMASCFCLPICINNCTLSLTNNLMIPHPSLVVDRLANCP